MENRPPTRLLAGSRLLTMISYSLDYLSFVVGFSFMGSFSALTLAVFVWLYVAQFLFRRMLYLPRLPLRSSVFLIYVYFPITLLHF